ncbi:hypothetical protein HH212_03910 [Massilia forsythiae]|uniref:Phage holin family protein n=1 Tax=Massilia forsythiae TaxID=2728020 RepID=A0A7Z2VU96_9BURK|nr:phage holin family protein [Massilia forsythiae]QJD99283.1 hypothetical protein HH212_03910 [Massilia forsythiae]
MAILAAARCAASTLLDMAHTRLALAAVEFREDAQRMLVYLAMGAVAVFLVCGAIMLAALFVIVLFWDTYPLQATAGMAILFALGALAILLKIKSALGAHPPMLQSTIAELKNDVAQLRGHAAAVTSSNPAERHAHPEKTHG